MALKCDPKGILFGTGEILNPSTTAGGDSEQQQKARAEQARLRQLLDRTLGGKRILLCSGADDKLVPYACSEDFIDFLRAASATWYRDGDLDVDDRVYPGVGHAFAPPMITDALRFLTDAVAEFHNGRSSSSGAAVDIRYELQPQPQHHSPPGSKM